MKTLKILLLTTCLVGFSYVTTLLAQNQTTGYSAGDASITLVEMTEVTKITDLIFGDIIPHSGGSVKINPASGEREALAGVSLLGTSFSVASFEVTGAPSQTFSIPVGNYPTAITLKNAQNNTMTVSNFVIHPDGGQLGSNGKITIKAGATLMVGANQPAGVYTNTTDFVITVSFQ